MHRISLIEYRKKIREERKIFFKQPYDLVYEKFVELGYKSTSKDFFLNSASEVVEKLRESCWNEYKPLERKFTAAILRGLINKEKVKTLGPEDAIVNFIEQYPEEIYNLTLSNTQSRRSRAGKEFESIIELVLIGSGIYFDSQGIIGRRSFVDKGLSKLVDLVLPGSFEYGINKRNTVLISAKTTLRERWQEVPEEMDRTGAREMFLATLDTGISDEVLDILYEANVQITTTKNIKNIHYKDNDRVLTFEELIKICIDTSAEWGNFYYTAPQIAQKAELIKKQMEKHKEHQFVFEHYKKILKTLT